MKQLNTDITPEVSGGSELPGTGETSDVNPLPYPAPTYPQTPVGPVLQDDIVTIRL